MDELVQRQAPGAKTSISVMEMQKLLGLGKTDAYWLVKKKLFRTIIAGKRMRIMLDSFEAWYDGQSHYKKVSEHQGGEFDGVNR